MRDIAGLLGAILLVAVLVACGEPAVDLDVPARNGGQHVLDRADLLADSGVDERLGHIDELDVVAVTYETERASLGEADRAGGLVAEEWGADIVLVAVARPGDFENPDAEARSRFFGLHAPDRFAISRGLREDLVDDVVPPYTAENAWPEAFHAAVEHIEQELQTARE